MLPSMGAAMLIRQVVLGRMSSCTRTLSYVAAASSTSLYASGESLVAQLQDKSLLRLQGYIGGQWADATDGATFDVDNPATGEVIARVPNFTGPETSAAITAASKAFPAWKAKTAKERGQIMRKWYDAVIGATDDIATIMTAECGKPLAESKAEILSGAASIEWFAEEGRRICGDLLESTNKDLRMVTTKQPVVLKPAEATPLTALALAELAHRSGIPPGVLNIVVGDAKAIGDEMLASDVVRKIGFTGSTAVGKKLMAGAAATVKRVSLELGGNAPFIVFDDADVETAAAGVVASAFRNAGQTCICANRVFVQEGVYNAFTKAVTEKVAQFKLGDGLKQGTTLGPLINAKAVQRVEEHVEDAKSKGGTVLIGGKRLSLHGELAGGHFYEPTVIGEATTAMRIYQEETFGPAIPCFRFKEDMEAVDMANDTEYGLAAYFYTKDLARAWKAAEHIEYGMIGINETSIGSEVAPFGGLKHSGLGKELSKYGIEEFLSMKYLCFNVGYNKSL